LPPNHVASVISFGYKHILPLDQYIYRHLNAINFNISIMTQELSKVFMRYDRFLCESHDIFAGACICCMILIDYRYLFIANLGDTVGVVIKSDEISAPIYISPIHHPVGDELERIEHGGVFTVRNERIDGMINISRAFGDRSFKMDRNS